MGQLLHCKVDEFLLNNMVSPKSIRNQCFTYKTPNSEVQKLHFISVGKCEHVTVEQITKDTIFYYMIFLTVLNRTMHFLQT